MLHHKSFIIGPYRSSLDFILFFLGALDLWRHFYVSVTFPFVASVTHLSLSIKCLWPFVKVSVSSLSFHSSDNYTSLKVKAHTHKFTLTLHLIFHPFSGWRRAPPFPVPGTFFPPSSFLPLLPPALVFTAWHVPALFLSDKTETAPWCHRELGAYEIICCLIKIIALSESSRRATSLLFDG